MNDVIAFIKFLFWAVLLGMAGLTVNGVIGVLKWVFKRGDEEKKALPTYVAHIVGGLLGFVLVILLGKMYLGMFV